MTLEALNSPSAQRRFVAPVRKAGAMMQHHVLYERVDTDARRGLTDGSRVFVLERASDGRAEAEINLTPLSDLGHKAVVGLMDRTPGASLDPQILRRSILKAFQATPDMSEGYIPLTGTNLNPDEVAQVFPPSPSEPDKFVVDHSRF